MSCPTQQVVKVISFRMNVSRTYFVVSFVCLPYGISLSLQNEFDDLRARRVQVHGLRLHRYTYAGCIVDFLCSASRNYHLVELLLQLVGVFRCPFIGCVRVCLQREYLESKSKIKSKLIESKRRIARADALLCQREDESKKLRNPILYFISIENS